MSTDNYRESLPCRLSDHEIEMKGRYIASKISEIQRLRSNLQAAASQYKTDIKRCETEIDREKECINTSTEFRDTECEVRLNEPVNGMKTVVRLDTYEVVRVKPMDDYDCQLTLDDAAKLAEMGAEERGENDEEEPDDEEIFESESEVTEGDDMFPVVGSETGAEAESFTEDAPPATTSPLGLKPGDNITYRPRKGKAEVCATVVEVLPGEKLKVDHGIRRDEADMAVIAEDASVKFVPADQMA